MPTDLPYLPLALYELTYRARDHLALPAYPRSLWHGVFGLNLKRLACIVPDIECRHCLLLHQCDYSYLFSGPRPPHAELMRKYDTIPVPHVFRVDTALPPTIGAGRTFSVAMVLVAEANARLPLVIRTMAAAGEAGLGADRGRALLTEVVQRFPTRTAPHRVATAGRLLPPDPPEHPAEPPLPQQVRVHFRSPYKPSGDAAGPDGLDLGRLLMAIVRRISLLQYFYTGKKLEADFPALKDAAQSVRVIAHDLRLQSGRRASASHGTRIDTSGLLGHIDISMEGLAPLWPYMYLGQWLGVGKNASMGFGQYELKTLTSSGTFSE
jgi:hypothetical protein